MTATYKSLSDRIIDIGSNFKSLIDPDPLKQANDNFQDIIKSYILLCHAEFERYFEDLANALIDKLINTLLSAGIDKADKETLNTLLQSHKSVIKINNGIKFSNLEKMYSPLNIDLSKVDELYKSNLGNLAKKRGEIAHKGEAMILTSLVFDAEKNNIEWLMNETKDQIDVLFDGR